VSVAFVQAVWAAGGAPVLLPTALPADSAASFLDKLDGLILTGGGDVDPEFYGDAREESTTGVVAERDAFEIGIARRAVALRLPVLAVCRGIQVLNVALGGSLIQDLVTAGWDEHHSVQSPSAMHDVHVAPGTLLAAAVEVERMRVNSLHHQAVRGLGQRLRPAAVATDGIVEAVELEGPGWALGVQWHPELMLQSDPIQLRIFRELMGQARSRMNLAAADAAAAGCG
jgi:putative glutamine amidotransferase